jgi:CRP/FNR family transcriptional regulator, cyclic AMP receptor protein
MNLSGKQEETCELQRSMQLIKNVPLFSALSPDFFRVLAYLCERQTFSEKQIIQREGEMADAAMVLVRGTAHIFRGDRHVATIGKGQCVGGLSLLGRFRWLYSLRAESEVECLLLPRHKVLPQFMARPDALISVAGELIGAVVDWDQRQLERPEEMSAYGLGMV